MTQIVIDGSERPKTFCVRQNARNYWTQRVDCSGTLCLAC